jgi:hypothetical protein
LKAVKKGGSGSEEVRENKWKGLNGPKQSIITAGIHGETSLNTDLEISNKR